MSIKKIIWVEGGSSVGKSTAIYNALMGYLGTPLTSVLLHEDLTTCVYLKGTPGVCFAMAADQKGIIENNVKIAHESGCETLVEAFNTKHVSGNYATWWKNALSRYSITAKPISIPIGSKAGVLTVASAILRHL